MSTPDTPTNQDLAEDAYQEFLRGDWARLGITGDRELALCDRLRHYAESRRPVPDPLLYQAARVWRENRDRILEERAWEEADLYTDCQTCPACGCPGSN